MIFRDALALSSGIMLTCAAFDICVGICNLYDGETVKGLLMLVLAVAVGVIGYAFWRERLWMP